jgi:hypothetical protein
MDTKAGVRRRISDWKIYSLLGFRDAMYRITASGQEKESGVIRISRTRLGNLDSGMKTLL